MTAKRRRHPAYYTYVYPFGAGTTTGRIDQGQDFGGSGAIKAIGRAKIVKLGAPGWPGGAGILYQLLEGQYAGRYVYVNEGVKPSVRVGQVVEPGATIGHLIPGSPTGIEIGWADARGVPLSHSEYTEGKVTKAGSAFAHFLSNLKEGKGPGGGFLTGFSSPAERRRIEGLADEENLKEDAIPSPGEAAGSIASEVADGIGSLFASHAEPLMLNVALVGGGAFLVYYGAALMLGVKRPVKGPTEAAAKVAAVAPK